jgi:hypothetical protein
MFIDFPSVSHDSRTGLVREAIPPRGQTTASITSATMAARIVLPFSADARVGSPKLPLGESLGDFGSLGESGPRKGPRGEGRSFGPAHVDQPRDREHLAADWKVASDRLALPA